MKTYLRKLIVCWSCIMLCVFNNVYSASETSDGLQEIKRYEKVREALIFKDSSGQWPENIQPISQLLANGSDSERTEACFAIIEYLHTKKGTTTNRHKLVSLLAKFLQDPSPIIKTRIAKWLITINPDDFGPEAKLYIENAFNAKPTKQLILLSGIADIPAINNKIKEYIFIPSFKPVVGCFYGTLEWAAELLRARKGDQESIKKVLKAVENEKNMVTRMRVLRELEYVRQPEIIIYLKKYLNCNDRLEAVKPTVPGMKCAQYAAVILARMLNGFPVLKEDFNYTEKELEICRKWMDSQNKWVFN